MTVQMRSSNGGRTQPYSRRGGGQRKPGSTLGTNESIRSDRGRPRINGGRMWWCRSARGRMWMRRSAGGCTWLCGGAGKRADYNRQDVDQVSSIRLVTGHSWLGVGDGDNGRTWSCRSIYRKKIMQRSNGNNTRLVKSSKNSKLT